MKVFFKKTISKKKEITKEKKDVISEYEQEVKKVSTEKSKKVQLVSEKKQKKKEYKRPVGFNLQTNLGKAVNSLQQTEDLASFLEVLISNYSKIINKLIFRNQKVKEGMRYPKIKFPSLLIKRNDFIKALTLNDICFDDVHKLPAQFVVNVKFKGHAYFPCMTFYIGPNDEKKSNAETMFIRSGTRQTYFIVPFNDKKRDLAFLKLVRKQTFGGDTEFYRSLKDRLDPSVYEKKRLERLESLPDLIDKKLARKGKKIRKNSYLFTKKPGKTSFLICNYLKKVVEVAVSLVPGDKFAVCWDIMKGELSVCDSELKKEYYKYKLVLNDMYHWMENFYIVSPEKTKITNILSQKLALKGKKIKKNAYLFDKKPGRKYYYICQYLRKTLRVATSLPFVGIARLGCYLFATVN